MEKYFSRSKEGKNITLFGGLTGGKSKSDFYYEGDSDFKGKYDYYITIGMLLNKILKKADGINSIKKGIEISAPFTCVGKKSSPVVEKHSLKVKYIALRVNKTLDFDKLSIVADSEDDPDNENYQIFYVPIRLLIPAFEFPDAEYAAMIRSANHFKCTSKVDTLNGVSIFDLTSDIFLASKKNTKYRNVKVIL